MNTLANHGYISRKYGVLFCSNCVSLILSRSGITSFEEIILGTEEAFNLNRDMASAMAANNMVRMSMFRRISSVIYPRKLTRGNPFVNKISIGGVSSFVPPLPGQIDGPETQGIAKHGRVEGWELLTWDYG
jgi:hypothetical protein